MSIIHMFVLIFLLEGVHSQTSRDDINITNPGHKPKSPPVTLKRVGHDRVIVDNGIIQVTFSNPQGLVTGIKYNGFNNVLDEQTENRGYWDIYWYEQGKQRQIDHLIGEKFDIISQTNEHVEISFSKRWKISERSSKVPLNIDKRYIIRRNVSGIYMYGVLERFKGWPDVDMDQTRIVFKLNRTKFDYMAISDHRQKTMAFPSDRDITRGHASELAYPEAVHLIRPQNPVLIGQVDDKYMYSMEDKDNKVHGWISTKQHIGFWMITPSDEFRTCGPIKQDLTSHVGPTVLSMFTSTHYVGKGINTTYVSKEPWKKMFGPVFVYLNSAPSPKHLWTDAKEQMEKEVQSWPYEFVKSVDYPLSHHRGTIKGQLYVMDRYFKKSKVFAELAFVGLASPGEAGSWQTENKGYQFWRRADKTGSFKISNVRPGTYNLYGWVNGFIGDYKYEHLITIKPGSDINLGSLVYEPPRYGPTLWEIGIPDRTAAEFYIPDPESTLMTNLSSDSPNPSKDRFRQYGLWSRYSALYPHKDLIYTVGVSDYKKDWFYAQVTRIIGKERYEATTWQIVFHLRGVTKTGTYTLQMALASATTADLLVWVNDAKSKPILSTGTIGRDNAIARHGIHGLYKFYKLPVHGNLLREGKNSIFLTQRNATLFSGVMYDYIRLEGPSGVHKLYDKHE